LLAQLLEPTHLSFDRLDLLLQVLHACLGHRAWVAVGAVQVRQIAGDALLELLHARLELVFGEVPVSTIDRLELTAVDRHQRVGEEVQAAA
jgi:hypothetical protein